LIFKFVLFYHILIEHIMLFQINISYTYKFEYYQNLFDLYRYLCFECITGDIYKEKLRGEKYGFKI
jgi:hypothetical protein